jgi:hypothetical protein
VPQPVPPEDGQHQGVHPMASHRCLALISEIGAQLPRSRL